jgi:hypothetical protein
LLSRSPVGLHVIATARNKDAIKDLEAMGMSTLSLEVTSNKSIAKAKEEVELLTKGRLDIVSANTFPLTSYMDEQADYCLVLVGQQCVRVHLPSRCPLH